MFPSSDAQVHNNVLIGHPTIFTESGTKYRKSKSRHVEILGDRNPIFKFPTNENTKITNSNILNVHCIALILVH